MRLSQGLPHYVHSLGLQAVRSAIHAATTDVTMEAVDTGINQALGHASQSLLDSYLKATSSPQKESLYKHVLLSCALAKTDDLSYFTSAAVRPPLKEMGRPLEIPAFASHLKMGFKRLLLLHHSFLFEREGAAISLYRPPDKSHVQLRAGMRSADEFKLFQMLMEDHTSMKRP